MSDLEKIITKMSQHLEALTKAVEEHQKITIGLLKRVTALEGRVYGDQK